MIKCVRCGETKPISEMVKDKYVKGGISKVCKECKNSITNGIRKSASLTIKQGVCCRRLEREGTSYKDREGPQIQKYIE